MSQKYSLSLIRLNIQALQQRLATFQCNKVSYKKQLFSSCHFYIASSITSCIQKLNSHLHNFVEKGKSKNIQNLCPNPPTETAHETSTVSIAVSSASADSTVRCVPDSVVLSAAEKSLLSKGLNFVPTTPHADQFQNHHDIQSFFRRLLLKAFFFDKDSQDDNTSESAGHFTKLSKKPSNFTPKSS